MKSKQMHFDDEVKMSPQDILAMMVAAIQVIMPYVLGFMLLYCLGIFILVKFWLKQ